MGTQLMMAEEFIDRNVMITTTMKAMYIILITHLRNLEMNFKYIAPFNSQTMFNKLLKKLNSFFQESRENRNGHTENRF